MKTVVVIGAGPAGILAAIAAKTAGAETILLEKNSSPGKKLLASGGGRCNLTNLIPMDKFLRRYNPSGSNQFLSPALKSFDQNALRAFFHTLGVETIVENGTFVYPRSQRSAEVLHALIRECEQREITIKTTCEAISIHLNQERIIGVETSAGTVPCEAIVIASGGLGYSSLGGGSDGYRLARICGHRVVKPLPALVPLKIREKWLCRLSGVSIDDVLIKINGLNTKHSYSGPLLITHKGISGPSVLNSSAIVSRLLQQTGKPIGLKICLDNSSDAAVWRERFIFWQQKEGAKTVTSLLSRFLPRSFVTAVLDLMNIPPHIKAGDLKKETRSALISALTDLPVTVESTEGFEKAMVTNGGISRTEIDPRSLRSRYVSNLYFAGEIIDIDGPCGGYNLQWAFSSGRLAGLSAAED